jgi:AmiR/NasT family two-component response regulator
MTPSSVGRRTVLVSGDDNLRLYLRRTIKNWGYIVAAEGTTSTDMLHLVKQQKPDVVVFEARLPDGDGLEVLRQLYDEQNIVAAAVIAESTDLARICNAAEQFYLACAFKPLREDDVLIAVQIALVNFDHMHRLTQENDTLRQALADRKIIERAKGMLMEQRKLPEAGAYRRMQHHAMRSRMKLVLVAQAIIDGKLHL